FRWARPQATVAFHSGRKAASNGAAPLPWPRVQHACHIAPLGSGVASTKKEQAMRKRVLRIPVGGGILAAALAVSAAPGAFDTRSPGVIGVAVFGDAPYGTTPTDDAEFKALPAFIDAINADRDVSLVLHVGDIHSGKQYCTEAYDRAVFHAYAA